ncbi:MAG: hypothetical protein R3359_12410, partial [Marinirhabdus sp.]|nr:hypothetical protein [Marinirhabdus sp.]
MRYVLFVLLATFAFTSCRNEHNVETVVDPAASEMVEESEETTSIPYPAELESVFEAHGGLAVWNRMNNLCFEMEGRNGTEIHTTNLNNRITKIELKDWSIGYDGENVWLLQNKEN